VALFILAQYGRDPLTFVLTSALFFGVFGEIYSLFPATAGDTFGSSFAATNAGMLYTAKGTGALLVPIASVLAAAYGWHAVFVVALTFNTLAALLAFFALRPLRAQFLAASHIGSMPLGQPEPNSPLV